jgi:transposase
MKRTRRNHGVAFKATVALAAVKGDKTLAELAEQFQVQPTPITDWKQQLQDRAMDVFGGTKPPSEAPDLKTLHAKIGQLILECVFRPKPATHSDGKVRAKVEHVFLVIKQIFGWAKVRYRGLAKNTNWLFVTCGLTNLYLARRRLLVGT